MKLLKLQFLFIFVLLTLLTGCACITPAIEKENIKNTRVLEAAAKLDKIQSSGNIKADFSKELDETFGKLSDSNTELYLFLTAIECYLKHGKIGQAIAVDLAQGVRKKYLAMNPILSKYPIAGISDQIHSLEQSVIRGGDHGEAILETYQRLGIGVDK